MSDPVDSILPAVPAPPRRGACAVLTDWGLLRVHGADAPGFLQAQLTNDVLSLTPDEVRLVGYCSVKGRLLASFWVWRDADGPDASPVFWLACSRRLVATVAKRLAMFVLRAKVKIEDATDGLAVIGLLGADVPADLTTPGQVPVGPIRPLPAVVLDPLIVPLLPELDGLTAPTSGAGAGDPHRLVHRAVLVLPAPALEPVRDALHRDGWLPVAESLWQRVEVLSGVARIVPETQDLFVPQMVNFERVGGVSFRKGCYPGQEVVARSQYLGKLKRRLYLGYGEGLPPAAAADVDPFDAPAGPIGHVVQSAPLALPGRFVVQFECRTDGMPTPGPDANRTPAGAVVRIGGADIMLLPLPYRIVDAAPADAA